MKNASNSVQISFIENTAVEYYEKNHEINAALERWKQAQAYFDSISDDELVDFASFQLETARRCYCFLVNREKNRLSYGFIN